MITTTFLLHFAHFFTLSLSLSLSLSPLSLSTPFFLSLKLMYILCPNFKCGFYFSTSCKGPEPSQRHRPDSVLWIQVFETYSFFKKTLNWASFNIQFHIPILKSINSHSPSLIPPPPLPDSYFLSFQRRRTSLERDEIYSLLGECQSQSKSFETTYTGQRLANEYFKIYGHVLDYSSVPEVDRKQDRQTDRQKDENKKQI